MIVSIASVKKWLSVSREKRRRTGKREGPGGRVPVSRIIGDCNNQ